MSNSEDILKEEEPIINDKAANDIRLTFVLTNPENGSRDVVVEKLLVPHEGGAESEEGNPKIGINSILEIGTIVWDKPEYHTKKYIYPVGYKAERHYASYKNPGDRTIYTCEVEEGPSGPVFKVTPSDDQETVFTSSTPTRCWTNVIKRVNEAGGRIYTTVSGPEYFGLSNPKVQRMIESLPDADKCKKYQRKFDDAVPVVKKKRGRKSKKEKEAMIAAGIELPQPQQKESKKRKLSKTKQENEDQDYQDDGVKVNETDYELLEEEEDTEVKTPRKKGRKPKNPDDDSNLSEAQREAIKQQFKPPNAYPGVSRGRLPDIQNYQSRCPQWNIPVYNGHDGMGEVYKQYNADPNLNIHNPFSMMTNNNNNNANIPRDTIKETQTLRNMWEFAYVCYCCKLLRPILKISEFDAQDFESAMLNPSKYNQLISDICIRVIKGPAIDRKSLSYIDESNTTWMSILKNKITSLPTKYWLWQTNPLFNCDFNNLNASWRVIILRALMDWKFDTNQRVIEYSRTHYDTTMRIAPLGKFESTGDLIWYFGEEIGRLFLEKAPVQFESNQDDVHHHRDVNDANLNFDDNNTIVQNGKWSVLCATVNDFKELVIKMQDSEFESERSIADQIRDTFIPNIEAYAMEREMERSKQQAENEARELAARKKREQQEAERAKQLQEQNKQREMIMLKQQQYQLQQLQSFQSSTNPNNPIQVYSPMNNNHHPSLPPLPSAASSLIHHNNNNNMRTPNRVPPPPMPNSMLFTPPTQPHGTTSMLTLLTQSSPMFMNTPTKSSSTIHQLPFTPQQSTPPPPPPEDNTTPASRTRSSRGLKNRTSYAELEHLSEDDEDDEPEESKKSKKKSSSSSSSSKKKKKSADQDEDEEYKANAASDDDDDDYHIEEEQDDDDDEDAKYSSQEDQDDDDQDEDDEDDDDDDHRGKRGRKKKSTAPRFNKKQIPHTGVMSAGGSKINLYNLSQGNMAHAPPIFQWNMGGGFNAATNTNTTITPQHNTNLFIHQPQQQQQGMVNHPLIQQLQQSSNSHHHVNVGGNGGGGLNRAIVQGTSMHHVPLNYGANNQQQGHRQVAPPPMPTTMMGLLNNANPYANNNNPNTRFQFVNHNQQLQQNGNLQRIQHQQQQGMQQFQFHQQRQMPMQQQQQQQEHGGGDHVSEYFK
ncbi:transforming growth factor beta regulator 1 [Acrasis kona]|uniref:Transforming growth factor beta regulator 1 n=1 Tax=Acrasis kona TaxID=1008807 RepID=A0AAW2ZRS2_9EUKA